MARRVRVDVGCQHNWLDGPAAAQVVELDEPGGNGTVVVDVYAAGVAFPDALQSRGRYQHKAPLPFIPGAEAAGVVRSAPGGIGTSAQDARLAAQPRIDNRPRRRGHLDAHMKRHHDDYHANHPDA